MWQTGLPDGVSPEFFRILSGADPEEIPDDRLVFAETDDTNVFYFGVKQTPGDIPGAISKLFKADVSKTVGENVVAGSIPRRK